MTEHAPSELLNHWIDGGPWTGDPARVGDVYNPATGEVARQVAFASGAVVDAAVEAAAKAGRGWGATSLTRRTQVLFAFREILNARKADLAAIITSEHGKVRSDALGEVSRGLEVVEFACGMPHLLKGGLSSEVVRRRRRLLDPPAARRGRRDLAVQLPGHGAALVRADRDRGRQRGDPQAEREGPVGRAVPRRVLARGRPARRRLHRRARGQGGRRRAAHARRREGGVVRRLDPDRALRLRDGHRARQAGPGARRRQEPHGGPARRRPRPRRRRRRQRGLRLGRRALHGDLRDRGGRPDRRHAGRQDRRAHGRAAHR